MKSSPTTLLKRLGLRSDNAGVFCGEWIGNGPVLKSISPIDGKQLGRVRTANAADYELAVERAGKAFQSWQTMPAPKRGEIIRQLGNALRAAKADLGKLVTLEAGKITAEGEGEAQRVLEDFQRRTGLTIVPPAPVE